MTPNLINAFEIKNLIKNTQKIQKCISKIENDRTTRTYYKEVSFYFIINQISIMPIFYIIYILYILYIIHTYIYIYIFFSYKKTDRGFVVEARPTLFDYFSGMVIFHNLHIQYQNSKFKTRPRQRSNFEC